MTYQRLEIMPEYEMTFTQFEYYAVDHPDCGGIREYDS